MLRTKGIIIIAGGETPKGQILKGSALRSFRHKEVQQAEQRATSEHHAPHPQTHVLHTVSKCRHESKGVAVYHGTRQHHDDAELLRPCDLRFRKGRNGTSGGIAEWLVLLPPYYFWIQNYAEKHKDMPSISRYDKWRKSLKIQDLSPFAEI